MSFSAFSRFGHTGFSSREPRGKGIYLSMRKGLGSSFDQSFDDNPVQAKLYAQAMALARCLYLLQRVKNNAIAMKATDLLPVLEAIFGLRPRPTESVWERRRALHRRMQVPKGAGRGAVLTIVEDVLGSNFVDWIYATVDNFVRFPNLPSSARTYGNDVPPGTRARVLRTLEIAPRSVPVTVAVEELTPVIAAAPTGDSSGVNYAAEEQALAGATFIVQPGSHYRQERIVATAVDIDEATGKVTSISTSAFVYPHGPGTILSTQSFPAWRSNAQAHRFILTDEAARNPETRRKLSAELSRVMRTVATWSITDDTPFTVGEGLLGISPIGE